MTQKLHLIWALFPARKEELSSKWMIFRKSIAFCYPFRNLDYVCKENGNCIVDVTRRNQCQSCRFKKCLAVNMKKEGTKGISLLRGRPNFKSRPLSRFEWGSRAGAPGLSFAILRPALNINFWPICWMNIPFPEPWHLNKERNRDRPNHCMLRCWMQWMEKARSCSQSARDVGFWILFIDYREARGDAFSVS